MQFRVKSSNSSTGWQQGKKGDRYLSKVVTYEEDFDYLDPEDPDGSQYTLPFDPYTVLDMLESLPNGVKWNPRTSQFEGSNGSNPWR